jgi:hypothetical protein
MYSDMIDSKKFEGVEKRYGTEAYPVEGFFNENRYHSIESRHLTHLYNAAPKC